ncbi:MAG: hypothetical protein ACHQ5A_03315, partial [Opitutales bacterium]
MTGGEVWFYTVRQFRRSLLVSLFCFVSSILVAADELPDYQPQLHVTGMLRSCGNPQMTALLHRWEAGFKRLQPDVQFAD